jgi:hypothetical protein
MFYNMEKDIILTTAASYQSKDGILTLSSRKLQWSIQGEKSPTIDTTISEIKSNFMFFEKILFRSQNFIYLLLNSISNVYYQLRFFRRQTKRRRSKI